MGLKTSAVIVLVGLLAAVAHAGPANLFANPSFEMGSGSWRMDKDKGTEASFAVDSAEAADGRHSMVVTIEKVAGWGTQFGQTFEAGARGKTYTFAVVARSVGGPVPVRLEIERPANPYDRVVRSEVFTLAPDKWTELHVTFKVEKDYPEGWFAYISCTAAGARYRVDLFRLAEGKYVPYQEATKADAAGAAARLFDTGTASAAPLSPDAVVKRQGWTALAEDDTSHAFRGDAVLVNDRLAVVVRRQGRGAEVYAARGAGAAMRAVLAPAAPGGAPPERLASVKVTANDPGAVAVDAAYAAGGKTFSVNLSLAMGQPFVETVPRAAAALAVEAPCRFAVLPDFFADDLVIDAAELPAAQAELAADHFLLHLVPGGEAIVMAVWDPAGEYAEATIAGDGDARRIERSVIPYGKKGKVWVAVLEGPAVWHAHTVAKADAGRTVPMEWRQPFPAQWRLDWRRDDGLSDSWEMVAQRPDGRFTKIGWFGGEDTLPADRKRWTTVLGSFQYPCWIDREGRGQVQPIKKGLVCEGPAVLYPINRARATPLDVFTVVDVVRATLGVGPCEYVLDVEGQRSEYRGRATCSNRDVLNGIFSKKEQKKRRAEVEQSLVEVMIFIRHIRGRVEQYVTFGHDLLAYLAAEKKAHADLAGPIEDLERLTREIDARVAARKDSIKTPDEAARMIEEFRRTVLDDEGPDALAKCKKFTGAIVEIGGSQDELVGECRWAVKVVRQRSAMAAAREPRLAEVAREIRTRSQKVLRNPAGHEGARH